MLRCFRHGVNALGNLDLARLTGLPKPTISRITYTLTELGYLRYHPDTGKYSPGYGVLALGYGLLAGLEVRELAKASMTELARQTGGAVALGAFDGDAMTYVEAVHGSSALYLRLPVGYRASLDSAMGRAYLASLPEDECAALAARMGEAAPDDAVICRARAELRETGCCFAIGEWQSDINAVAVPFASLTGEGVFVMSCGGPASLLSEAELRGRVAQSLADAVEGPAAPEAARPSPRGAGPQALRPAVGISYNPRIDPPDCVPGGPFGQTFTSRSAGRRPPLAPGFRNGAGRAGVAGRGHGRRLAAAGAVAGGLPPRRRAHARLPGPPGAGRAAGESAGGRLAAPAGSGGAGRRIRLG